ncbi:TIGR02587 family membrane protein [Pontibacter harenae]|uniref:TIGR02587 family membrane protein n=1 Tax=Pontibacter harenae TaxID=2894083 RepID=UPI001E2D9DEA|nr:TIGR02587 family membrane protein [Pontibacter harenae]MCC9169134.1 TIGR02587 family membrane protein [Pontibacter harenae]
MKTVVSNKDFNSLSRSLKEYARGIAGGLLFSFPLLYTMEVWWAGFIGSPLQLFIMVVATYLLLLGYNRYAGMRPSASWRSVFIDSVEEMGLGITISLIVLAILNRIQFHQMSIDEIMGKVIMEAMAVSIGVSIGTAQLGDISEDEEVPHRDETEEDSGVKDGNIHYPSLIILSICGSIVVGGNVAPTEEVTMIAVEAKPIHVLLMALTSIALSVVVVFFSDFRGADKLDTKKLIVGMTIDTCLSYLTALACSALLLWFFGSFNNVSFEIAFAQCIVLGVLASLGASAGRLLIK